MPQKQPPDTLPSDFFEKQGKPPDELPADFDFGGGQTARENMLGGIGKGFAKEATRRVATIGNVLTTPYYALKEAGTIQSPVDTFKKGQQKIDERFAARGPWQKVGAGAEQFAEFFIPIGPSKIKAAANAPQWAKVLAGGGQAAVDTFLKSFAQSGDLESSLKSAGVSGALGSGFTAVSGAKVFGGVPSALSSEEARGVSALESRGVPMSAGDKTGNKVLKTIEQKGEYFPGSHGPISEFRQGQRVAGRQALEGLPGEIGGASGRTAEQTGEGVERAVRGSIQELKGKADAAYSKVRDLMAKSGKQTTIGTTQSSILDASGKPVQIAVKGMSEAPVPMAPVREALRPYYEELTGRLPVTVREASPGYSALRQVMEGKEASVDALKLDRDLSTIKGFLRREGSTIKDKSGRYASAVVSELERGVQQAIVTASPEALAALKEGRSAVRQYYMQEELLSRLLPKNADSSVVFQRLTNPNGQILNNLKELSRIAPDQVENVARTYAEGMVRDITANGKLERLGNALQKFRTMKPEVKEILFRGNAGEVEDVLRGLQQIGADTNPSGSAKWIAISALLHGAAAAVGAAVEAAMGGHVGPVAGSAPLAGYALSVVAANKLAKLLTSPKGVEALQRVIRVPEGSASMMSKALQGLQAQIQKPDMESSGRPETGLEGRVRIAPPSSAPAK